MLEKRPNIFYIDFRKWNNEQIWWFIHSTYPLNFYNINGSSLTQATDTSNIRLVFAAVKETILQNALRDAGVL